MEKYENKTGTKLRCIKGWKRVGLKRGQIYTCALRTQSIYLSAGDLAEPTGGGLTETGPTKPRTLSLKNSTLVEFAEPMVVVAELGFNYFLNASRFEEVEPQTQAQPARF